MTAPAQPALGESVSKVVSESVGKSTRKSVSASVKTARSIIRGDVQPIGAEALDLVRTLKRERQFGYARRVLARVRERVAVDDEKRVRLGQQHALCTYKDPDLPVEQKLDRALAILRQVDDPDVPDAEQETLGIAGAIWKRWWETDAQRGHLERALAYYTAGYERGIARDDGYTAINAAFVLDLLAAEDAPLVALSPSVAEAIDERRARASRIRSEIVEALAPRCRGLASRGSSLGWWPLVTLAEAEFGLGRYGAALNTLRRALRLEGVDEWERESTARQVAALARLHAPDRSVKELAYLPAWRVVARLVGSNAMGIRGAFAGKVGLALSGGGFRASLFHIGVLARLAELDVLRHVEVLSCVSGGSIVGAHYYLKVKRLLEGKPDGEITRADYIAIVKELERDFLAGVQRNIRMRVLAEFTTNVRMLVLRSFTRTQRAGELYEAELYSRMQGDGAVRDRRVWYMRDLMITPAGGRPNFHPRDHNWQRAAKVPILVLNATTLNTGHNWQFTATWMGEPPGNIDVDIDGNYQLRRLYYAEAPEPYDTQKPIRLGQAVAASAAVPGLFDPLELRDLYVHETEGNEARRPITVRLVDGGVHDNQGTASLAEQQCAVQLVSDASGQMSSVDEPSAGTLGVLLRTTSIQGARIRVAQHDELTARRRAAVLRGLMFVHLKRGLGVRHIDWRDCEEPHAVFGDRPVEAAPPVADERLTSYRMPKALQALLADVRTDLDSFSDAEAYALMLSGYRMTTHDIRSCGVELGDDEPKAPERWAFRQIESAVDGVGGAPAGRHAHERLLRLATVAKARALKIWRLAPLLRALGAVLVVGLVGWAGWIAYRERDAILVSLTLGGAALSVATILLVYLLGSVLKRLLTLVQYRKTLRQVLFSLLFAAGGFLVARLHLVLFDRWYLWWGSISRFHPSGPPR